MESAVPRACRAKRISKYSALAMRAATRCTAKSVRSSVTVSPIWVSVLTHFAFNS